MYGGGDGGKEGVSLRETGRSCGVGHATVHDVVTRAKMAGLSWPLPEDLDEAASWAVRFETRAKGPTLAGDFRSLVEYEKGPNRPAPPA